MNRLPMVIRPTSTITPVRAASGQLKIAAAEARPPGFEIVPRRPSWLESTIPHAAASAGLVLAASPAAISGIDSSLFVLGAVLLVGGAVCWRWGRPAIQEAVINRSLKRPEMREVLEAARRVLSAEGRENRDRALEELRQAVSGLAKTPLLALALRLERGLGQVQRGRRQYYEAQEGLAVVTNRLESRQLEFLLQKIQRRYGNFFVRWTRNPIELRAALQASQEIIPRLEKKDRLRPALKIVDCAWHQTYEVRKAAFETLEVVGSSLDRQQLRAVAQKILKNVRNHTLWEKWTASPEWDYRDALHALTRVMKQPEFKDHNAVIERIIDKARSRKWRERQIAAYALGELTPLLPQERQIFAAHTLVELLSDGELQVRGAAEFALTQFDHLEHKGKGVIYHLSSQDRVTTALEIDAGWRDGHQRLRESLKQIIPALAGPARLVFLEGMIVQRGLPNLPLDIVSLVLKEIPPEALSRFAEEQKNKDLVRLARFFSANLPHEDLSLWNAYLKADDPEAFLEETVPPPYR